MNRSLIEKAAQEASKFFCDQNNTPASMHALALQEHRKMVREAYRTGLSMCQNLPQEALTVKMPPIPPGLSESDKAEIKVHQQKMAEMFARSSDKRHTLLISTNRQLVTALFTRMGIKPGTAGELVEDIFVAKP